MLTVNYYNDFFEIGQKKVNFSFYELSLPDDDTVYTLKKVMEDLDFSGLLANCSDKGRTGYNRKPKRDAFYEFKSKKLTSDIPDDLNYQFMRRLQKEGFVTLKELFIDGTKIEAKYPDKVTKPKCLVFVRIFLFCSAGSKITYLPTIRFSFIK